MAKYVSQENLTQYDELIKQHIKGKDDTISQSITTHINDKSNPHNVTKAQIGLGNVDNTSDLDKPVSNAVQEALNKKQNTLVSGTNIKTLNGQTLLGSGDITLDLSLYKVVTALPTTDIDVNKIYLVLSSSEETNLYTEYVYVNSKWEKLGEYKAEVDLTPYLTKEEAEDTYVQRTNALEGPLHYERDTTVNPENVILKARQSVTKSLISNYYVKIPVATLINAGAMSPYDKGKVEGSLGIVYTGSIPDDFYAGAILYGTYIDNGAPSPAPNTGWHRVLESGEKVFLASDSPYIPKYFYYIKLNTFNIVSLSIARKSDPPEIIQDIQSLLDKKVDKVEGKGLSTNDYTDGDKNKLNAVYSSFPYPMNAYGVEWDCTNSSQDLTRIGNMSMHKTLPIQSKLKGCVAKNGEIQYYLDPTDWSKKEDGTPSRLDGYDGVVQVDTGGKFYLWSEEIGNIRRVWISEYKCVPYAYEVPRMLIDAYKATILRSVPSDMGYLSTLPVNSAVSICNTATYCRGGYNNTDRDKYLSTDPTRTQLGKPATKMSLTNMRTYARNAGREVLNYYQYKAILYWLFVIEYATFNEQKEVNDELTSEGYKQGGLGTGVTNLNYVIYYNDNYTASTTCGYTNDLGNFSGKKDLVLPSMLYTYNQAPLYLPSMSPYQYFSEEDHTYYYVAQFTGEAATYKTTVTKIRNTNNAVGADNRCGIFHFKVEGLTDGQTMIMTGAEEGTITISTDGEYTASFTSPNAMVIKFGKVQDSCNIVITGISTDSVEWSSYEQTTYPNRYRGFENPFGEYRTTLEGILYQGVGPEYEYSNIYTTNNPEFYTSSAEDLGRMTLLGTEKLNTSAFWVRDYNLGYNAELLSRDTTGGNAPTYIGSYRAVGTRTSTLRKILVGGESFNNFVARLACLHSISAISTADFTAGFRTCKILD